MSQSITRQKKHVTLLSAKASTGSSAAFPVADYKHLVLTFSTQSNANLTVQVQVSNSVTAPDFSAAASATNEWDYVQCKRKPTDAAVNSDGSTGHAWTGTDGVRIFRVNDDAPEWIGVTVSACSAGSVNVKLAAYDNA